MEKTPSEQFSQPIHFTSQTLTSVTSVGTSMAVDTPKVAKSIGKTVKLEMSVDAENVKSSGKMPKSPLPLQKTANTKKKNRTKKEKKEAKRRREHLLQEPAPVNESMSTTKPPIKPKVIFVGSWHVCAYCTQYYPCPYGKWGWAEPGEVTCLCAGQTDGVFVDHPCAGRMLDNLRLSGTAQTFEDLLPDLEEDAEDPEDLLGISY